MTGIIYLICCIVFAKLLLERFAPSFVAQFAKPFRFEDKSMNTVWIYWPLYLTLGVMVFTWILYLLCLAFAGTGSALSYAVPVMIAIFALLAVLLFLTQKPKVKQSYVQDEKRLKKELILFGVMLVYITLLMRHTFFVRDEFMNVGSSVYSDFAPHISMIRSFSSFNNFPTQYPFFGGEGIKYHFFFNFLIGALEFMGVRIDIAFNLMSIVCLLNVCMLLYSFAYRLFVRGWIGAVSIALFFFRSGLALPIFIFKTIRDTGWGSLLKTLIENRDFIGDTANEVWGLWNVNVYLNQRHLAFGLSILLLFILFFMPYLAASYERGKRSFSGWLRDIFRAENWWFGDVRSALLCGIFLGLASFWHGAAVIATLLVLFVMAVGSRAKLDYLVTAFLTIIFSSIQSALLAGGSAVKMQLHFGFIAAEPTISAVLLYLLLVWGVALIMYVLAFFVFRGKSLHMLIALAAPMVFAFTMSLTPDIVVNHKYLLMSWMLLAPFIGSGVVWLFRHRFNVLKIVAVILLIVLTCTGIYDTYCVWQRNTEGNRLVVASHDEVTQWIQNQITEKDLVLTPMLTLTDETVSGMMMYNGWPYYAWSAGYDTDARGAQQEQIYNCRDQDTLRKLVAETGVDYIFIDDNGRADYEIDESLFTSTYETVFTSDKGNLIVLKVSA